MKGTVRTHFFTTIFATTNMIASAQQKIDNPFDLYREGHYYYYRTHAHPNSTLTTGTEEKEFSLIEGVTHIQTYYVPEYVDKASKKLNEFFGQYLQTLEFIFNSLL
jgi:hypothetical protein